VIFLTIGTHEPFDRLVRAVDAWCETTEMGSRVFGQITDPRHGAYRPQHFEWVVRLAPQDYDRRIAASDLIVSHAGMGTILTALHHGKPIVVMPRRGHLRETRNDHQFTTVRMLRGRPGLYVADDETRLGSVLGLALAELSQPGMSPAIPALADGRFTDALHAFLTGQSVAGK
jgi:UDP-N-acetylglucosamine transferase subunit ALG13